MKHVTIEVSSDGKITEHIYADKQTRATVRETLRKLNKRNR